MLRLRQIAFATNDLPRAERTLIDALGVELCHRDPNLITFGLENALFPVGDQFLEIVAPVQDNTTAARLLDKRGGDTGYMALFQVDDLAPVEDRLERHNVRVVHEAHEDGIRGLHLHPKDVPGAIVSIDAASEPAKWPWAGAIWRDLARSRPDRHGHLDHRNGGQHRRPGGHLHHMGEGARREPRTEPTDHAR